MNWKDKALAATKGSRFGAVLAAAMGVEIPAPCFHGKATLTSDGYLIVDFTGSDGRYHMGAFAGSVADVERNVDGLTDHLKLTDVEATKLRLVVRNWMKA
jgi:hypothetical protein